MADKSTAETAAAPPAGRSRRLPLLVGGIAALLLGGGGGFAMYSGWLDGLPGIGPRSGPAVLSSADTAFVALPAMVVSLGGGPPARQLRFAATLDVPRAHQAEVARAMPRVVDVLNTYLRALDPAEFDRPEVLFRIRAQMMRRLALVLGEDRVRDLLITEFVLN